MVRFKNRYILAEVIWEDRLVDASFGPQQLLQSLRDVILLNFGDYGIACVSQALQGASCCFFFFPKSCNKYRNLLTFFSFFFIL